MLVSARPSMVRLEQLPIFCSDSATPASANGDVSRDPEHVRVQLELQSRNADTDEQQENPQRHCGRALHAMDLPFGAAASSVVRIVSQTIDNPFFLFLYFLTFEHLLCYIGFLLQTRYVIFTCMHRSNSTLVVLVVFSSVPVSACTLLEGVRLPVRGRVSAPLHEKLKG